MMLSQTYDSVTMAGSCVEQAALGRGRDIRAWPAATSARPVSASAWPAAPFAWAAAASTWVVAALACAALFLALTFVFPGTSSADSLYTYKMAVSGECNYDAAAEVVSLVNQQRSSAGLSSLAADSELSHAAAQRAAEIAVTFSHMRPNGDTCESISSKVRGENIAGGFTSADAVMNAWMSSQGHCANILGSSYVSIGVGCYTTGNSTYWVQLFSTESSSGSVSTGTETQKHLIEVSSSTELADSSCYTQVRSGFVRDLDNTNDVYYFKADGSMVRGLARIYGYYRYFDENGIRQYGAQDVTWANVINDDGTHCDGEVHEMYFDDTGDRPSGIMQTGYLKLDRESSKLAASTAAAGTYGVYYYRYNGEKLYGLAKVYGFYRYFDPTTGERQYGRQQVQWKDVVNDDGTHSDGQTHEMYFDDSGTSPSGIMKSGDFVKCSDGVRYYKLSGEMAVGLVKVYGYWRYFDADGLRQYGWVTLEDGSRYFDLYTGIAYTGTCTIDGQEFCFNEDTACRYILGEEVVAIAKQYLGVKYVYGGASPSTGFDCSGFVMYCYAQVGISLPHSSRLQYWEGTPVDSDELLPGDLVFFGKSISTISHVGIYIGDGKYIHAPKTGDVVEIASLSARSNFVGACRLSA